MLNIYRFIFHNSAWHHTSAAIVKASMYALQEKVDLGELMLSLCYLPTAGRLTVTIIKARNLKAMDITGTSGNMMHR